MARKKTNPNNANQYVLDPRQAIFLEYYLDPKSDTFSNGLQSAIKAGYEPTYAEVLVAKMPSWLSEKVGDESMIAKAEKNLNDMLDLEVDNDVGVLRVKADITKFVAERLGKKKYSARTEHTGKDGERLPAPILANLTQVNGISSNNGVTKDT